MKETFKVYSVQYWNDRTVNIKWCEVSSQMKKSYGY